MHKINTSSKLIAKLRLFFICTVFISTFSDHGSAASISPEDVKAQEYLSRFFFEWMVTDDIVLLFSQTVALIRPHLSPVHQQCLASEEEPLSCMASSITYLICQTMNKNPVSSGCEMSVYRDVVSRKKEQLHELTTSHSHGSFFTGMKVSKNYFLQKGDLLSVHLNRLLHERLSQYKYNIHKLSPEHLLAQLTETLYAFNQEQLMNDALEHLDYILQETAQARLEFQEEDKKRRFVENLIRIFNEDYDEVFLPLNQKYLNYLQYRIHDYLIGSTWHYLLRSGSIAIGLSVLYCACNQILSTFHALLRLQRLQARHGGFPA